ncbi:MAG: hypothetical protein WC654_04440 [Patescibacteria group bacterium]
MRRSLVLIALGLAVGFLAGASIRPTHAGLIYDGVEFWRSDASGPTVPSKAEQLVACEQQLKEATANWDALPSVVKYLFGPEE